MSRSTVASAATLLAAGDPDPVEALRLDGASPFFLTCEHAGREFPARLGTLGLDREHLDRHIAYDIGAMPVARILSESLDAPLVGQRYSRLVVDCNRAPHAHDFATPFSEDTAIPGNEGLAGADRDQREREIFRPYHDCIRGALDAREVAGQPTVVVSVHSCTPVYLGVARPWHIGVLYERDRRLAGHMLEVLDAAPDLVVGDNEPYFMTDAKDYSVPVHGEQRGLLHVEIEIRQDLVGDAGGQSEFAEILAEALRESLGRAREQGLADF